MERDWMSILKEAADEVYSAVSPLLGTEISRETVGLGAGGDSTKHIDALAEDVIIQYLKRKQVSCTLISEERGTIRIGQGKEAYLIVDSIDGTTNAVRGISFASTALAVSAADRLSEMRAAIVMRLDNGKAYTAKKGEGAEYDGAKVKPSSVKRFREAVIAVDISRSPENIDRILPLLKASSHIRCLGSAALEICHVASGQLDASIDVRGKLRTTDIAAAALILKEAGGVLLGPDGKDLEDVPLTVISRFSLIAAANMDLFHEIMKTLDEGSAIQV